MSGEEKSIFKIRQLLVWTLFFILTCLDLKFVHAQDFFDCTQLDDLLEDKEALDVLTQAYDNKNKFSETCMQILVNKNFFSSLDFLVNNVYNENSDSDVVPLLRRFISKVREKQDALLDLANGKRKQLTLSPAFQWAQDLNSVALSIKIAHRLDAPS